MGLMDLIYESPTQAVGATRQYNLPQLTERLLSGQYGYPGGYGAGTSTSTGGGGIDDLLAGYGGTSGYSTSAYAPAWSSTQGAAELAHKQNIEVLQIQHQQALDRGDREAATALKNQIDILNRQFQQDIKKMDIQNKWDSLEAQKQRAFQAGENELGRQFEREQMKLQQEFEKEMRQEELSFERQRVYSEMMGKDPVRAALYAMGVGGEILPGGERFGGLPPMEGAEPRARQTEQALTGLLSRQGQPEADIRLGEAGVTGLPDVVKAATAYQRGGQPAKTLLESAFGVGATTGKGRPGVSPEETQRLIQSVTPRGTLQY